MIEKVVVKHIGRIGSGAAADLGYWLARTAGKRIEAVELLRK